MKKITTTLLVSSLALGGFTVANADSDRFERGDRFERFGYSGKVCDKKGKRFGYRNDYMFERLDLSKEQVKKVRSIRDNYRPKMETLSDKARDNRKKLREAMHSDSINQNQVKKLAKVMGDLKEDKIILRAEIRTEIHKVLTKEQREEINNMKEDRGFGHRRNHRG